MSKTMMIAPRTIIQLEIWYPTIDVFRLNHSIAFLPDRPPLSGIIIAKAGRIADRISAQARRIAANIAKLPDLLRKP
jgi:hypothetical protein